MDCNKITVRLQEIKKVAEAAKKRLGNGDSTGVLNSLNVIEAHLNGIRAEMDYQRYSS